MRVNINLISVYTSIALTITLFQGSVSAQINKSDSLLKLVENSKSDYEKHRREVEYARHLRKVSMDSCNSYVESLIEKYKDNNEIAYTRFLALKADNMGYAGKHKESLKLALEVLQRQLKDSNNYEGIAETYMVLSGASTECKRFKEAQEYSKKAIEYFNLIENKDSVQQLSVFRIYYSMAVGEHRQKQYPKAIAHFYKALEQSQKLSMHEPMAYSHLGLAGMYDAIGETDSFHTHLLKSVDIYKNKLGHKQLPINAINGLGHYYEHKGNFNKALHYRLLVIERAKESQHVRQEVFYTKTLADYYSRRNQYEKAFNTFKEYFKRKTYLDSINTASEVARIEGKFEQAQNLNEIANLKSKNLEIENRSKQIFNTVLIVALFVVSLGAWFIFTYYKKIQASKLNQSQLKAKLEVVKLMALRSRMNPHFLFNCINTAQGFILNSNKRDAYDYLEKFAKLIRKILDGAPYLYQSLDDEVNQLKLYLELERIRLREKLSYNLSVDEKLEGGIYEIPGMILQPIVENALIHGIYNLEDRNGNIEIDISKGENRLLVTIKDNGVGRVMARQIKARKQKKYKSVAMPNIHERLSIINGNNLGDIQMKTQDLYENEKASGTLVSIEMPLN